MVQRSLPLALVLTMGCGGRLIDDASADATPDSNTADPADPTPSDPSDSSTDPGAPPDAPPAAATDKLDLLFVIDNSSSMADKQGQLAAAIPGMLAALVDGTGGKKAFESVHVGVITSSLGSHGTSACAVSITHRSNDDRAHLLPRSGEGGGIGFTLDSTGMRAREDLARHPARLPPHPRDVAPRPWSRAAHDRRGARAPRWSDGRAGLRTHVRRRAPRSARRPVGA